MVLQIYVFAQGEMDDSAKSKFSSYLGECQIQLTLQAHGVIYSPLWCLAYLYNIAEVKALLKPLTCQHLDLWITVSPIMHKQNFTLFGFSSEKADSELGQDGRL